jgi:hypothetical protein
LISVVFVEIFVVKNLKIKIGSAMILAEMKIREIGSLSLQLTAKFTGTVRLWCTTTPPPAAAVPFVALLVSALRAVVTLGVWSRIYESVSAKI